MLTQPPPPAPVEADDAFVERLVALDPDAWQGLFNAYFKKMYSFAMVRTGDSHLAEEIAVEVFAAAARGIHTYRPTGAPIGAWLYRITHNLTVDELKRRARRPSVSLDTVDVESPSPFAALDERTDILDAISRLTPAQQEVLTLRFFSDCSIAEAAEAMGKSQNATKVLLHRALTALRSRLGVR